MKKIILALLILSAGIAPVFIVKNRYYSPDRVRVEKSVCPIDLKSCQDNILKYLKLRKDGLALEEVRKALAIKSDDLCALWAKAELLRRAHNLKDSQDLLNEILSKYPDHIPSLITLSYIKYHNNDFTGSGKLLRKVLKNPELERENRALAYVLLGSINAKKASLGGFLCKITNGFNIKSFFEKAKLFAPDLSEVRLALGSFYLLAPKIAGGDIDKAIEELEYAVRFTPDFATANARLAQAYNKKGDLKKYNLYIQRAEELDPENEVLLEIKESQ